MRFLTNILWVFSTFSFIGWVTAFIYRSARKRKLVNPGFITLPFLPAVGISAVGVYFLSLVSDNPYMLFFGSAILLTVGNIVSGMAFEKFFGFKWKDRSDRKFSLNGYVMLWEPLVYGELGLLTAQWGYRPIQELAAAIPPLVSLLIPAIISGLTVADFIISVTTVLHLRRNLRQMKNISKLIDDNTSVLSDDELRAIYKKKCVTSKRFRKRLVNAFPDMQSINYEKQFADLKQRIDIIRERNDEEYEKKIVNPGDQPFAYGLTFTKLFWLFLVCSFFGTVL